MKPVSSLMVILLILSALTLAFIVYAAEADGTVYIRADGSIDPPTTPIITIDNVTYFLTGNVYGSVVLERDSIVIDGSGYAIEGNGTGIGITLSSRTNVTIRNVKVKHFDCGIYLHSSFNNTLSNNDVTASNTQGVHLSISSSNTLSMNNITMNHGSGIVLTASSNNVLSDNTVKTNNWHGLWLDSSSSNLLSSNNITDNRYGIWLDNSSSNTFAINRVTNSNNGIYLDCSPNNTLSGNMMDGNRYNLGVQGDSLNDFMNSIDASNTVVGKPVYYFVNQSDMVISPSAYPEIGYLSFVNCVNVTVKGLDLKSNLRGLLLAFTNDSKIADNNVASNGDGIYLFCSSNDTLSGNRVKDNDWSGICLCSSDNTTLITNDVTNNNVGIYVCYYSNDNVLSGNQVTGNWYGIFLGYSSSNILLSNTVIENYKYGFRATLSQSNVLTGNNVTRNGEGISLYSSSDNRIFHNNIVNNSRNVVAEDSKNIWDDGYPSGGNYWSDYAGIDLFGGLHQNASGSDWIGDSPFIIDPSNFDRYPLMNAYVSELEETRAAYRALLLTQNQMLSALESLNLTVLELTGNLADMQKRSDNAASELDATRVNLQTQIDSLNQTCTGQNQSIADLQAQMGSLNSTLQASVNRLDNQLNNVLSVLYALAVATIVLATVTVYLGTRKPKAKP